MRVKIRVSFVAAAFVIGFVYPRGGAAATFLAGSCPGATHATIQAAVTAASAGDTINVCVQTFSESVTVNKAVTLRGNQVGVDARTRGAVAESIISGAGGAAPINITASGVVIDGFTLTNATNVNTGFSAVIIGAGVSATHILDNIVNNSITGMSLANGSGGQLLIQHNLIANNNQPGPSSGDGIYSDQFVAGGTLQNVLIDANTFSGQSDAGILLSSTDPTKPATNVTISNNLFDGNARSIALFNTTSSSFTGNTSQNSSGNATADLRLFEGVNRLSITNNTLNNGVGRAMRISNVGSGAPDATNVSLHQNSITGYTGPASIVQIDNYTGTVDATCNWWGSSTGPTNAANPGGTGQSVSSQVNFTPWLDAAPPGGVCVGGATMSVVQGSPQSTTVATAFGTSLQVSITSGGNPLSNIAVTFTPNTGGSGASGTFSGSTTVNTNVSGVASSPALTANTIAGSFTVTATAGASLSATFNLVNNPGPASTIVASQGTPQSAQVGTAFGTALQATVHDSFGNTVPGVSVTFTAPASGASATFSGSTTVLTGASGVATAPALTANSIAGSYTVTAQTGAANAAFSLTNNPAPATHLSVAAPASASAGNAFNITVTALDQFGNTATGYGGTVHFTSSDGAATLPANSGLTNGSGTFSVTLKTAGNQTITAADTVTGSINGTSSTIVVNSAAATHFTVTAPSTATAGNPIGITVTAQDQFNNTATAYAGTVHFTSTDVQAVLPANSGLTSGTGAFSVTLKAGGNQTVTATDTVNSAINGTSGAIAVTAVADLSITKTGPATANPGTDVTYNIAVSNNGPSDAQTVSINDTLPPGTTFVSESQNTGPSFNCAVPAAGGTGAIACTIGTLVSSTNATFTVVLHTSSANLSNLATISSATNDPNPGNNNATAVTGINAADLGLTESVNAPLAFGGQNLTYTFVISNAGPSAATSVVLTDTLPAGASLVSSTPPGACSGSPTVTCSFASIGNGASVTITLVVQSPAAGGTLTNSGTVNAAQFDPNAANNAATTTAVFAPASAIPTMSDLGLLLLVAAFAAIAMLKLRG